MNKLNPHIDLVLAALLWGSNGIFVKYLDLPVVTISFFRLSIPALILLVFFILKGIKLFRTENKLVLLGSFLNGTRVLLYFVGFTFTSIGNAIIIHYTFPIFLAIFSIYFLKEKATKEQILVFAMAFAGVVIMFLGKEISFASKDFIGMAAMLISAVLTAIVTLITKTLSKVLSEYEQIFYQNFIGTVLLAPLIFLFPLPNVAQLSIVTLQSFIIGFLAFVLFYSGLKRVKASTAGLICYLELVSAIIFAFIFFREIPTLNMLLGGFLIIFAVMTLSIKEHRTVKQEAVAL